MLSTYVRVPHGADPKPAALTEILWSAQRKHVFLARPLDLKITPISGGIRTAPPRTPTPRIQKP